MRLKRKDIVYLSAIIIYVLNTKFDLLTGVFDTISLLCGLYVVWYMLTDQRNK